MNTRGDASVPNRFVLVKWFLGRLNLRWPLTGVEREDT